MSSRSLTMSPHIGVLLVLLFLCVLCSQGSNTSSVGLGEPRIRCIEAERQALLKVKQNLWLWNNSMPDILSSWGNEEEKKDCCKWLGIRCANNSGHHVIELDLSLSASASAFNVSNQILWLLRGNISSSLVELSYLKRLDFSGIGFHGIRIPSFLGTLSKLRYLNLSYTGIVGEIPPQLGNLSRLEVLDLSNNYYYPHLGVENLGWLSHLSSLRVLDLSFLDLSKADDWLQIINNKLPYLTSLKLTDCGLPNYIIHSSLSLTNSSASLSDLDLSQNMNLSNSIYQWVFNFNQSLVHLDLSFNQLPDSIPEAFGNMTALTHLDLSDNLLQGEIPNFIWSLCKLRTLDLSRNNLSGELPDYTVSSSKCGRYSLEKLDLSGNRIKGPISDHSLVSSFKELKLSRNQLNGAVPESIGQLTELVSLDLSGNSLKGVITEAHFLKLSKLYYLGFSFNQLILNTSFDWIPPFQLEYLLFASCKLGPRFPKWIQTQNNLLYLDISSSGISDSIPNWLWNLSPTLQHLNLSNNQISGTINKLSFEFQGNSNIDLSLNQLEGSVPVSLFKVAALRLFGNKFSKIDSLCDISEDAYLYFLDISNNQLYGELPDCWSHFKSLNALLLANNKLSGKFPISLGSLTQIRTLHLGYNNLTGDIPSSLMNCTKLVVLDVGENKLSGPVPTWVSDIPNIVILSLRSNHFYGSIPSNLCNLQSLQLLDL